MDNVTELKPKEQSVDDLASELLNAKYAEDQARNKRVALEQELIERIGTKEEGSQTRKTDHYKITTTAKLNRKVDWKKYEAIKDKIPENLRPVTYKPQLETKGIKYLEQNEPETFAVMAECMSTEPAKPAVKVELLHTPEAS